MWYNSTGKKKKSIARVFIRKSLNGLGSILINKKYKIKEYFNNNKINHNFVLESLKLTNCSNLEIKINVRGGGKISQIFACLSGISKSLALYNKDFKKMLAYSGMLTRDSRVVERKKLGKKKSRKSKQFSKR